jgi:hypothetical protein
MAEDFRAMKEHNARRKQERYEDAMAKLEASEFAHQYKQVGEALRFGNQRYWMLDYYPTTGRWNSFDRTRKGFGIDHLLNFMRKINRSKEHLNYRIY